MLSEAIIGGVKALGSAIAGIGKAFIGAMKDGVEYNAQMENYTASFTTMLGDEAKAQKLVNDLKKKQQLHHLECRILPNQLKPL
ncbi:hypothetical protein KK421_15865 [Clostridioides difficile]|nr:hypothetical protein [Clostridioides difficile]